MPARRSALPALALALALGVTGVAGCGGDDGQVTRSAGLDTAQGFVAGEGTVSTWPAAERGAPVDFSGPLLDGGTFDLAAERGRVVVLNVWASWCPPCRAEAPALEAAWQELRGRDVRMVGVNTKDSTAQARGYVREFGLTFPSVVDDTGERLLAFRESVPPRAIPTTLVIDPEGRVAARVLGEVERSTVVGLVEDVLAEAGAGRAA